MTYDDSELEPEATIKKYLIVQTEGSRQAVLRVRFEEGAGEKQLEMEEANEGEKE